MTKSLTDLFFKTYINDDEEAAQDIAMLTQKEPNLVASHYYFYVGEAINYYSKQLEVNITITPIVYFDTNNFLYDQYMEPVEIILGDDASEIASSSYTMNYPSSSAQVEKLLLSKGFIKDSKFDQFLSKNIK